MASSTLGKARLRFSTPGLKQVTVRVTSGDLVTEQVIEKVINPAPVPPISAVLNEPFGYAKIGGVTGGAGGDVYTADTTDKLKTHWASDSPRIVIATPGVLNKVAGMQGFYGKGNKTVIGMPGTVINYGLWLYGDTQRDNVIVRNLIGKNMPGTAATERDYFTAKEGPNKGWIDRMELHQTSGVDGLLDLGDGVENYTVSHIKCVGAPRAMSFGSQLNKITGSFMWFQDCTERQPAVSQGKVHLVNIFYESVTTSNTSGYGVSVRDGAEVRVDNLVFRNFKMHPFREQRDLVSGSTTVYKPLGKFDGLETTLYINSGTNQLRGQPESTYVHTDDMDDLILPTSEVEAYCRKNCGATLTAQQVTDYIAYITTSL